MRHYITKAFGLISGIAYEILMSAIAMLVFVILLGIIIAAFFFW